MKLKCLIVEDEPLARNLLIDYVKKVSFLELTDALSNPLRALEVLKNRAVDLMFLDIQMPELTGITLLKTLQKKPLVVLTTAYSEYAIESFDLDVVDYLLKPITFERFLKAVDRASQRMHAAPVQREGAVSKTPRTFVFVKDGTKFVRVNFEDILYIEGLKDYVTIVTQNQKIVTLQRLKSLENELPADQFIRIHHSWIISVKAIDAVHKTEVRIKSKLIPISDSYRKAFRELIGRNQI